ncbi:MAG: ABC transporter permease [Chlorobiaceae bacterium]|nr:ABC transporter permease [Chlorobiaceae bacterium]NTV60540.1 ABC transporter permease [Chlorobiaceae bacterium]
MRLQTKQLITPVLSILLAFLGSAAIIALTGRNPLVIFQKMSRAIFGSPYGLGQVLFRLGTLSLVGLAVAVPYRLRLFNIGGEGQLQMGAFSAAIAGAVLPGFFPGPAAAFICILAAMTAGASWALLAGALKVRFGINEVISTIMLNFIAQGITGYFLTYHFALPSTVHTAPVASGAFIPQLDSFTGLFNGSPANASIILSLGAALFFQFLLFHSRYGFEMRAAGLQAEASDYGGIDTARHILTAMAAGGAAAGLGAANIVLGYKHYYELGMTDGTGFTGIAVALLAGANPLLVVLTALFFAMLEYGGLSVNAYVPKDIFMIIQALTIFLVIGFNAARKK